MARNRNRSSKQSKPQTTGTGSNGIKVTNTDNTFSVSLNDTIAHNYGSLNYSFLPGVDILTDFQNYNTDEQSMSSIPGIMSIPVIPTIGAQSGVSTDAINLAAQQIYTKIRSVNSGARNFDPNNMMIHLMGMDSIYSFHAMMLRIYGLINSYSRSNYYVPNVIAEALDIDIADFRANYKDFLGYINLFAKRANTLVVPDVLPLITDHARMYNRVFMDANSVLGQMYVFAPYGFYKYEENVESGKRFGSLVFTPINTTDNPIKFADIVRYGDTLLNDMLNSQDMGNISAELQKAYSESALLTIPQIEGSYELQFIYDETMLLSIHNGTYLQKGYRGDGTLYTVEPGPITANPTDNNLSQEVKYTPAKYSVNQTQGVVTTGKELIDMHKEVPTIEDNYAAIRFKTIFTPDGRDTQLKAYGPEILLTPDVHYFTYNPVTKDKMMESNYIPQGIAITENSSASVELNTVALNSYFEMGPIMYFSKGAAWGSDEYCRLVRPIPIGELYNPTVVDSDTIVNMFKAYFLLLFGV